MIDSIRLINFRAFRDVTIPLKPLTMLVGPNGVGKSSVLEAIRQCSSGREGGNDIWFFNERLVSKTGPSDDIAIEIVVDGTLARWSVSIGTDEKRTLTPRFPRGTDNILICRLFRFAIHQLRAPWPADQPAEILGESGEGLAGRILRLKNSDDERPFEELHRTFLETFPQFSKLVPKLTDDAPSRMVLSFVRKEGFPLPVDKVGEGTLFALAILVAAIESKPGVILIDDIEHGLHPHAQLQVVAALQAILDRRPELQIIATTHSPSMIDALDGDQVILLAQDPVTGETKAAPVSRHPRYDEFKETLTPADFWSNDHEEWVLADPSVHAEETAESITA
jgi:predicted ATPase